MTTNQKPRFKVLPPDPRMTRKQLLRMKKLHFMWGDGAGRDWIEEEWDEFIKLLLLCQEEHGHQLHKLLNSIDQAQKDTNKYIDDLEKYIEKLEPSQ